ncbi:MAG: hypothetical protein KDD94_02960 [Calditrichaeota bacterium]|nr:hypothetical protein [Calditrichota bacterium]
MVYLNRFLRYIILLAVVIFAFVTIVLAIISYSRDIPFSYENNGSDILYHSSDGSWSAQESMLYGYSFRQIVYDFELYKLKCAKPDIYLVRLTAEKEFWRWSWWFDDYSSVKWRVPLSSDYSKQSAKADHVGSNCEDNDVTNDEMDLVRLKTNQYIAGLISK